MTDKEFIEFINKRDLPVSEITKAVGCSKSTITRWKEGRSYPHPAIRAWVVEEIQKLSCP